MPSSSKAVSRGYPGIPVGFADISPVADAGRADPGDDTPNPVPYLIFPCARCWPWYAEVVVYGDPRHTWVREWHAVDSARWKDLLTPAEPAKASGSIFNPGPRC
jgi:hypothetical protein